MGTGAFNSFNAIPRLAKVFEQDRKKNRFQDAFTFFKFFINVLSIKKKLTLKNYFDHCAENGSFYPVWQERVSVRFQAVPRKLKAEERRTPLTR